MTKHGPKSRDEARLLIAEALQRDASALSAAGIGSPSGSNLRVTADGFFVHVIEKDCAYICSLAVPGVEHAAYLALPPASPGNAPALFDLDGWDVTFGRSLGKGGLLRREGPMVDGRPKQPALPDSWDNLNLVLDFADLYDGLTLADNWQATRALRSTVRLANGTLSSQPSKNTMTHVWEFQKRDKSTVCQAVSTKVTFSTQLKDPTVQLQSRADRTLKPLSYSLGPGDVHLKLLSVPLDGKTAGRRSPHEQYALDLSHFHAVAMLCDVDEKVMLNRPSKARRFSPPSGLELNPAFDFLEAGLPNCVAGKLFRKGVLRGPLDGQG